MRLIRGTTVTVIRRERAGTDRYGAPVWSESTEEVDGVLPQPGSTEDVGEERPEGVRVDMTFHFPRGYAGSLKGCAVEYAGRTYRVVGDPQPYLDADTPGEWDLTVEAEAVDG